VRQRDKRTSRIETDSHRFTEFAEEVRSDPNVIEEVKCQVEDLSNRRDLLRDLDQLTPQDDAGSVDGQSAVAPSDR
jgi:hypothetical protein